MRFMRIKWRSGWGRAAMVALALAAAVSCSKGPSVESVGDLLKAAWSDYSLAEYDRATAGFEQALAKASAGGEDQLKALYGLATTLNLRRPGEDPTRAGELYRQIVESAPDSDLAAWSALALVRMKHLVPVGEEPDYDAVCKGYEEVMTRYPDRLAGKEAFIHLNAVRVSTLRAPEARQALAALSDYVKNPSNTFLGPAWSLIAVCQTTLGNPDEQLRAELKALENTELDPANPYNEFAWAYWNIATIAEFEAGDFELARTYYRKLIAEYPRDLRVYGARQALKRMDEVEAKIRAELAGGG